MAVGRRFPAAAVARGFLSLACNLLLVLSVGGEAGPGEHYTRIVDVAVYRRVLLNTFGIAFLVTLLSIVLSYPLAYLLATVSANTRKLLFVLVLLPFWTSALVRTTAWIVLLQRNGVLNGVARIGRPGRRA